MLLPDGYYRHGGFEPFASMLVAGSHPDRIAAAASFHGGRIAVEDDPTSPHLLADRLRAAVYVAGAATHDAAAEQRHWDALEELYGSALKA